MSCEFEGKRVLMAIAVPDDRGEVEGFELVFDDNTLVRIFTVGDPTARVFVTPVFPATRRLSYPQSRFPLSPSWMAGVWGKSASDALGVDTLEVAEHI